ncbi:MAG TPA: hypothetical protein VFD51_01810 [Patescibacteria group bacterium]|nr:hypothetical protein [Patescibacteria group bacterium]
MKKLLWVLFVILPSFVWAQTEVVNATSGVIKVDGNNVPSRLTKIINFPVQNNIGTFEVEYFEGSYSKGPVKMYRRLDRRGRVKITNFNPETDLASKFNEASDEVSISKASSSALSPKFTASRDGWWSNVTVTPENKTEDYSIFVPSGPFMGLALKPGQKSVNSITLQTGKKMFPVLLGLDDGKSQSGVSFTWALFHKIITEGQEVLEIKVEDIMFTNRGNIITKKLVSQLPFNFKISEGAAQGIVIKANHYKKIKLFLGWNIIPVEYKDKDGLPTEAILILLVDDSREPLYVKKKTQRNNMSLEGNEIIVTGSSR